MMKPSQELGYKDDAQIRTDLVNVLEQLAKQKKCFSTSGFWLESLVSTCKKFKWSLDMSFKSVDSSNKCITHQLFSVHAG